MSQKSITTEICVVFLLLFRMLKLIRVLSILFQAILLFFFCFVFNVCLFVGLFGWLVRPFIRASVGLFGRSIVRSAVRSVA